MRGRAVRAGSRPVLSSVPLDAVVPAKRVEDRPRERIDAGLGRFAWTGDVQNADALLIEKATQPPGVIRRFNIA